MPARIDDEASSSTAHRTRALTLVVVTLLLTLAGVGPASAHPGLGSSGADPFAELKATVEQRGENEDEAERLSVEHGQARSALTAERAALAAVVTEREAAEVDLERAEQSVADAEGEMETATTRLNATTRQLKRMVAARDSEDGKLKVEVRETYKDGASGMVTAAVTFDALVVQDDPNDAMHTIDMLGRLAARRADGVVHLTTLADGLARTQAERAAQLLQRHTAYVAALDRREQRARALDDVRDREALQEARVAEADELVAALAQARADNQRAHAEIEHLIADWSTYVASLGAVSMRASVPPELAGYGNGQVPLRALAPIGVGAHRLWGPAAGAFKSLRAAASRDGIHIGVTDSYRSYASQVNLAGRKGLYAEGGLAARPGTSEHGWGLALDLDLDAAAQRWMRANARTYGFVENTPREPWHWVFTARPHT